METSTQELQQLKPTDKVYVRISGNSAVGTRISVAAVQSITAKYITLTNGMRFNANTGRLTGDADVWNPTYIHTGNAANNAEYKTYKLDKSRKSVEQQVAARLSSIPTEMLMRWFEESGN